MCFAEPAVTAIVIEPLASNTRAHKFYRRLGFVAEDRRTFGDDDCLVHRLTRLAWRQRFLHALCLKLFYRLGLDSCLEVDAKSVLFGSQVEGLGGMAYAAAIDARHGAWSAQLPKDTAGLWDVLCNLDGDSRQALFAHCVGLTINATCQPYDRRPKAIAHTDRLAEAVQLDMAEAGWHPTVATSLGRVTKARILEAVREAKGEQAAQLIEDLKKADMAREAERLLDGTGWLPEPLRLRVADASRSADAGEPEALPAFLAGDADGDLRRRGSACRVSHLCGRRTRPRHRPHPGRPAAAARLRTRASASPTVPRSPLNATAASTPPGGPATARGAWCGRLRRSRPCPPPSPSMSATSAPPT
jgi:hypothetical protein